MSSSARRRPRSPTPDSVNSTYPSSGGPTHRTSGRHRTPAVPRAGGHHCGGFAEDDAGPGGLAPGRLNHVIVRLQRKAHPYVRDAPFAWVRVSPS